MYFWKKLVKYNYKHRVKLNINMYHITNQRIMLSYTKRYNFKDFLLVYALIALSTIPFFMSTFGIVLAFSCIVFLYKKIFNVINFETVLFFIAIFVLEIYHATYFKNYETWVIRKILSYFFVSIFVIYYLKLDFLHIYIRIMYYITLISFFFFFTLILWPDIIKLVDSLIPTIFVKSLNIYEDVYVIKNPIIYNFDHNFYKIRNNGPFWEPTVFASLLLVGQIFNFLINKKLFNHTGLIFTIGILTTFSTTVFIAYFIFLVSSFLLSKKIKTVYKIILLIITIFSGIYLFTALPFLEEKISKEITELDSNMETRGDSRMASALLDIAEISGEDIYMFLGKGSSKYSRIGISDKTVLRNCGLTALFVEWGIPFALIYLSLLFYSFLQLTKHYGVSRLYSIPFTFIIILISFSEIFFDLPIFHALIFIGLVLKRYYYKKVYHADHIVDETKFNKNNYSLIVSKLEISSDIN